MNAINRNLQHKINHLLDLFPIVAIVGVRQCGKSVISKMIRPSWQYYDLEKASHYDLITRDVEFFLSEHPGKVIIDEAQLFPDLFKALRSKVDEDRSNYNRYLITGSSSYDLLKNISETLAGRVAIVELGTLKQNEINQSKLPDFYNILSSGKNLLGDLKQLSHGDEIETTSKKWFFGGYPEPILRQSNSPDLYNYWMENYFSTYINRDVRRIFPSLNLEKYQRFISMLAHLSGTIVVRKELAQSVEVSEPTIKDYLDIAHGTFVWRNIPSFEKNPNKAVMKMPKGHFRDTGLLHYLLKIRDYEELELHPTYGKSFETFVIEEILKGLEATSLTNWQYYYYRTRNKAEIDLILDGPFGIIPIEVKAGVKLREISLRAMKLFLKELNLPFGIVVNQSSQVEMIHPNIIQIPVSFL